MDNTPNINQKYLSCSIVKREEKINKKSKLLKISVSIFILSIIVCIIIQPNICINSIFNGLSIWAKCVLPSLFPFMFFTKLLTDLDFVSAISSKFAKLNKKLFCAPSISAYIFLMSIISGYPVGAKLICDFYQSGIITEKQANKLTTFCSTSGPLFIIGSVGTAMYLDKRIGYIMFFCHIVSSIINGIVFRKAYTDNTENKFDIETKKSLNDILPETMSSSITSILVVGGYIAISFLIVDILNNFNLLLPLNYLVKFVLSPFNIDINTAKALVNGLFEISKGCSSLAVLKLPLRQLATFGSFLIGFGGISVFFQATTFLNKCKINLKFYLLQKICHGIISGILTFVVCLIFKI